MSERIKIRRHTAKEMLVIFSAQWLTRTADGRALFERRLIQHRRSQCFARGRNLDSLRQTYIELDFRRGFTVEKIMGKFNTTIEEVHTIAERLPPHNRPNSRW